MNKFNPIKIMKKFRVPIALLTIVCIVGVYFFIDHEQSYSASILIQYVGAKAEKGLNPDDTPIDITEIYSATIIDRVVEAMELNCSVEEIRSAVLVTPVIPVTETEKEAAAIELNEEYSFTPTKYLITYTADSNHSEEYAREVLDSILTEYYNFYSEKYIENVVYPNNALSVSLDNYDYIECVELLRSNINSIAVYCAARDNTFYSAKSGYSFIDLQLEFEYLRDSLLLDLNAYILENQLTIDRELLLQKEANNITQYSIKISTTNDYIEKQKDVICQFAEKTLYGQLDMEDMANLGITNDVEEDAYKYRDAVITTYDALINKYANLMLEVNTYKSELAHAQRVIEAFSIDEEFEIDPAVYAAAEEKLDVILGRFNALYDSLVVTAKSYYGVRSANYLSFNTNIKTSENLNLKLYLVLGAFAAFVCWTCAFIAFDRLKEIFAETQQEIEIPQEAHKEKENVSQGKKGEGNNELFKK